MEQSGTNLDTGQGHVDQETVRHFFNKKYNYLKSHHWCLQNTSVFRHLCEKSAYAQGSENQYRNQKVSSVAPVNRNVTVTVGGKKPVPETESGDAKKSIEEHSGKRKDKNVYNFQDFSQKNLQCNPDIEKSHHPLFHVDCSATGPQIKSPHFTGRQTETTSKFRRKTVPVHQQLKRVHIQLPLVWQCDNLIAMKDELNSLKDKLSDKDMTTWHKHTSFTNLAGQIVGVVKKNYNAELCTQAWCKLHEVLASCEVVPESVLSQPEASLNSIHLCEAPGAFITSLNHYLVSRGFDSKKRWRWLGTTLNPYYEGNLTGHMISDDRFIRNTFNNWFYGTDNSGDLMCEENMLALMEQAQLMGDIHLITADGSIDCQENPAEQEVLVSRLHHSEVLCTCLLLAPGGTLVIKLFTMFEASSVTLLYFLNCVFEQVTVHKPATSKAGNSEVYAVCSGYTMPLSRDVLFSLFAEVCSCEDPHIVLLKKEDIPEDFLRAHTECCSYFSRHQSDTICQNLRLDELMEKDESDTILRLQGLCVDHYIKLCGLQMIADEDRIRPYRARNNKVSRFTDCGQGQDLYGACQTFAGRLQGTFQQRRQQSQSPWQQLLPHIQDYNVDKDMRLKIKCKMGTSKKAVELWGVLMGRRISSVASSRFCEARLLADLLLMLQHAQVRLHQEKAASEYSVTALTEAFRLLSVAMTGKHPHHHHHHHHHPTSPPPSPLSLYHLALEGSLTAFWPPGSHPPSLPPHRRLQSVRDLQDMEGQRIGMVVDVTLPECVGQEELRCQKRLLDVILNISGYLPPGSAVVILMPVALTRLTAGLLYILAGLFQETSFSCSEKGPFLHQTLCFHSFSPPSYSLLTLLETLRYAFQSYSDIFRRLSFSEQERNGGCVNQEMCVDGKSEVQHAGSLPHAQTVLGDGRSEVQHAGSLPHAQTVLGDGRSEVQHAGSLPLAQTVLGDGRSEVQHAGIMPHAQTVLGDGRSEVQHAGSLPHAQTVLGDGRSEVQHAGSLLHARTVLCDGRSEVQHTGSLHHTQLVLGDCRSEVQHTGSLPHAQTVLGDGRSEVQHTGSLPHAQTVLGDGRSEVQHAGSMPHAQTVLGDVRSEVQHARSLPHAQTVLGDGRSEVQHTGSLPHAQTVLGDGRSEVQHSRSLPHAQTVLGDGRSEVQHAGSLLHSQPDFGGKTLLQFGEDLNNDCVNCQHFAVPGQATTQGNGLAGFAQRQSVDMVVDDCEKIPDASDTDTEIQHRCSWNDSRVMLHDGKVRSKVDVCGCEGATKVDTDRRMSVDGEVPVHEEAVSAHLSNVSSSLGHRASSISSCSTQPNCPQSDCDMKDANQMRNMVNETSPKIQNCCNSLVGHSDLDSARKLESNIESCSYNSTALQPESKRTKLSSDGEKCSVPVLVGSSGLGQKRGGIADDKASSGVHCGRGAGHMGSGHVPLEIVPVLNIINDVTFTRFLQASNGHTIGRFLATLKAAEQDLLSSQKESCS